MMCSLLPPLCVMSLRGSEVFHGVMVGFGGGFFGGQAAAVR